MSITLLSYPKGIHGPIMASKDTSPSETGHANCRSMRRRQAFLDAAREVFLESGYEQASMSEIVRRAGGSLATLYAQFGDKLGLFLAMLDWRMGHITENMSLQLSSHTPIRKGLASIGLHFLENTLSRDSIDMYRLIIGLAPRMPEIAQRFMSNGPDSVRGALADYLKDRQDAGELHEDNVTSMASLFLEMLRSGLSTRALMDMDFHPTETDIEDSVNRAVNVFLRAYGTDGNATKV